MKYQNLGSSLPDNMDCSLKR